MARLLDFRAPVGGAAYGWAGEYNRGWNDCLKAASELLQPVAWLVNGEVFDSEAEAIEEIRQWGPSGSIATPLYRHPLADIR